MEITECKNNVKCELGACKNRAARTVKFDRVGIRSRIHVCDKCLNELYSAIGSTLVPKSLETARKKRAKKDAE